MKTCSIINGGRTLAARLFESAASSQKGVLLIHGWNSAQNRNEHLAETLAAQGFSCLTFDFSAHGESAGDLAQLSCADFLNDAIEAYDTLIRETGVREVAVIGSSFGSYIAAILTAHRPVARLILRAPSDYPDEGFTEVHEGGKWSGEKVTWRNERRSFSETMALRAVHAFGGELLLVESGADDVCPHQCIQNYADALKDQYKLTHFVQEGAPHSLTHVPAHKEVFERMVVSWLTGRE
jgi:esterase/lipase